MKRTTLGIALIPLLLMLPLQKSVSPKAAVDQVTIMLPGNVPLELVRIPAGSFMMGSTDDSSWSWCYPCERPYHAVDINNSFYIGKYEITQAQWLAVMGTWPGTAPSTEQGLGADYPAYFLSWNDCQNFITLLNQLGEVTFRLPSEAEWEYACRAGTTTRYHFGDSDCEPVSSGPCELDDYAWWYGINDGKTHPVGQKLPNDWELYDMLGNVMEWCQDYWHADYFDAPTDGSAWESPITDSRRVFRGGDWYPNARNCRSSFRDRDTPDERHALIGLRIVLESGFVAARGNWSLYP